MPVTEFPVTPRRLASMLMLIEQGTISGKIAKDLFEEMLSSTDEPSLIVERKGMLQVSDEGEIEKAIDAVLAANPAQVEKYLKGNEKVFGFFVGETMKATKGRANPKMANDILRRKLHALGR
jgi:aspartyl-tRNA(Asn)/glutamyl-tRNA(Gln) amidotransferase subunit B